MFSWLYKLFSRSSSNFPIKDLSKILSVPSTTNVIELLTVDFLSSLKKSVVVDIAKMLKCPTQGSKQSLIHSIVLKVNPNTKINSNKGYIYIVITEVTSQFKVGRTKYRPDVKAVVKYLYRRYRTSYGPSVSFILYKTPETYQDEKAIHDTLAKHRLGNSELFSTTLSSIKSTCSKITKNSGIHYNH